MKKKMHNVIKIIPKKKNHDRILKNLKHDK